MTEETKQPFYYHSRVHRTPDSEVWEIEDFYRENVEPVAWVDLHFHPLGGTFATLAVGESLTEEMVDRLIEEVRIELIEQLGPVELRVWQGRVMKPPHFLPEEGEEEAA